jgi:single-stranded-DNA-specific exonuclease
LEPYGVGNPEPVFAARSVRVTAPPRILKEKHVKLKLRAADTSPPDAHELSGEAILATPRCHPDGATIRRSEKAAAVAEGQPLTTEHREPRTTLKITFDALGWHMAERFGQTPLLAGDSIDVAFTVGHNDHPEYGGLELSLRDFKAGAS